MFWMVGLPARDGRQFVYRVYAPREALPGDLFWAAFHCHEEDGGPRVSDCFDAAEIRWIGGTGPATAELTVHQY
ncbi:hypothetical protein ACF1E9_25550 [Streptomyces roseolus]|uniref:hypothetical protein n=1 Tax=Streptomyces TaxID=1883 RepID=UPI00145E6C92|nr:hypothetical protein [Streptomyces roseolus]NML53701.1 hypothetical protein [Streptomyces sp. R301]NML82960.1 hypothetical protein [Streptomyces sp. R302]